MHKLNIAVGMAQTIIRNRQKEGWKQKVALIMHKDRHFAVFKNTEAQLMEDSILKDVILVLKDEGGELRKSYTTYDVRKLLKQLLAVHCQPLHPNQTVRKHVDDDFSSNAFGFGPFLCRGHRNIELRFRLAELPTDDEEAQQQK